MPGRGSSTVYSFAGAHHRAPNMEVLLCAPALQGGCCLVTSGRQPLFDRLGARRLLPYEGGGLPYEGGGLPCVGGVPYVAGGLPPGIGASPYGRVGCMHACMYVCMYVRCMYGHCIHT